MASAVVLAIEPHAVADVEPLDGAAQVGFGSLDHQVKMILGTNSHNEAFRCLGKQLDEMEPVGVATVTRFALVTTGGDMVTAPGRSMRSGLAMACIESRAINVGLSKVEIRTQGF
jgi:hypothetical protein